MNSPPVEPDQLGATLAEWHVVARRNPRFRAEVWARIERPKRAPTWSSYLRAHGALVASALVVAVLVGAWQGRERARERDAAARAALVADYVHGLDARWMRTP